MPIDSDKMYSGVVGYNDVAIDTARGRLETRVDRTPGSPAWPMTDADRGESTTPSLRATPPR